MTTSSLPNALDWLVEGSNGPTLVIGRSASPFAAGLAGQPLTLVDRDRDGVSAMLRRAPSAIPLVAAAEALPLAPCTFERVLLAQSFHQLAPGLALSEFARVLRPGGALTIVDAPNAREFPAGNALWLQFDAEYNCEPYSPAFVASAWATSSSRRLSPTSGS